MSLNRYRAQQAFESFYGGLNTQQWKEVKPDQKNLSKSECSVLQGNLNEDAKDLFYKGLVSIAEAISSIGHKRYSWATVKLYYSIFYFLRCSLACYGVIIIRCKKGIYYTKVREGETFTKVKERTDHKATIDIFNAIYGSGDILQSNFVNGKNPYDWLMGKREEVNYKDREFYEPLCPYFIEKINDHIKKDSLLKLVEKYINDKEYIYCFQEEDALLALPIKRLILTKEHMKSKGLINHLSEEKKNHVKTLLELGDSEFENTILNHFLL